MGGLVTPLPLTLHFADGSSESYIVPAEVWRYDASAVSQLIVRPKRVVSIEVDARHQTGDADFTNNIFPRRITPTKLEVFKGKSRDRNLMLDMMTELKSDKAAPKDDGAAAPLKPVP